MFQTVNGAEWLTLKLGRKKMSEKAFSNLLRKTYGAVPVDDSRKIAQSGE